MDKESGEFELIDRLTEIFGHPKPPAVGIGDDTAIFRPREGCDLLWTIDVQVEEIHYRAAWFSPEEIGARAAAVSLSDIAAMGGRPRYALVSFHLPLPFHTERVFRIARGMKEGFGRASAEVLGGNVTKGKEFAVEVSLLGEIDRGKALRRGGAKPGDTLWVTGLPGRGALAIQALKQGVAGDSALGPLVERWKRPTARLEEGGRLVDLASSCIDLSDGLLADAAHVARASGVDLILEESQLPTPAVATSLPQLLGFSWDELRFSPSDDYELLFTVPADRDTDVKAALGTEVTCIGTVEEGEGRIYLKRRDGKKVTLMPTGWDHMLNSL